MKITALQEYGLRCIYQLAVDSGRAPLTTSSIAEKEGLSRDYVEKILFQLRKTGLVKSVRGINGGYILTKNAKDITIGEIFMALSERRVRVSHVKDDLCKQFPGKENKCVHMSGCTIRLLWTLIITQVYDALNKMPLSTLVGTEKEVHGRLINFMGKTPMKEVERVFA